MAGGEGRHAVTHVFSRSEEDARHAVCRTTMENHSMEKPITFAITLTYLWVMMMFLGSMLIETLMIYPNIFHNVPESLATARKFMAVVTPHDFFPPLGLTCWISGLASLALNWRVNAARSWLLTSLLMMVAEGLCSMAFFWPRNRIMFVEGTAVHSAAFLRYTAREFQVMHWARVACNVLGSAAVLAGFLRFDRHRITPVAISEAQP